MGGREIVVASQLGKTVGWGRSLTWEDWVHVTNFVSRWLDSGFGVPNNEEGSTNGEAQSAAMDVDTQSGNKRTHATEEEEDPITAAK